MIHEFQRTGNIGKIRKFNTWIFLFVVIQIQTTKKYTIKTGYVIRNLYSKTMCTSNIYVTSTCAFCIWITANIFFYITVVEFSYLSNSSVTSPGEIKESYKKLLAFFLNRHFQHGYYIRPAVRAEIPMGMVWVGMGKVLELDELWLREWLNFTFYECIFS